MGENLKFDLLIEVSILLFVFLRCKYLLFKNNYFIYKSVKLYFSYMMYLVIFGEWEFVFLFYEI